MQPPCDRPVSREAGGLAPVSLVMASPAAASDTAPGKSLTVRIDVKEVPPTDTGLVPEAEERGPAMQASLNGRCRARTYDLLRVKLLRRYPPLLSARRATRDSLRTGIAKTLERPLPLERRQVVGPECGVARMWPRSAQSSRVGSLRSRTVPRSGSGSRQPAFRSPRHLCCETRGRGRLVDGRNGHIAVSSRTLRRSRGHRRDEHLDRCRSIDTFALHSDHR